MRKYIGFLLMGASILHAGTVPAMGASQPVPHRTIPLWPNGVPGNPPNPGAERDTTGPTDRLVAGKPVVRLINVATPTITLYSPAKNIDIGAAVVVFPGGGYHILAIDLEGTEICQWLNSIGVTAILLKYRVPDSGPFPKSSAAFQDAQRAVGLVRAHAEEWHIDPHRIGVLGFSAGGHLAVTLSNDFEKRIYDPVDAADQISCRPDFAVVIYPGYLALAEQNFALNPSIKVDPAGPPTFLVQAEDDPVHVENSLVYFLALKNAKLPAEMHIYAAGAHGYGLRRTELPITTWPETLAVWFHTIGVLH